MNIEKLRVLWDDHATTIHAYLRRLTKNDADAADHLQDLFCRLGRQPELLAKLHYEPRGYLLRLAHNAVVDHVRRAQVRERVFEKITAARAGEFAETADPDQAVLRSELFAALEELPEEQRVVVHARLWKMRTLEDIARELGVSINTAASRYRYGIDKMRTRLRSLYEDFAPAESSRPTPSMKKNSKNPFNNTTAESPMIRPLEARRVPSATGAAFTLPLPDHPDDAPVDEIAMEDVPLDEVPVEEVPVDEILLETELDSEIFTTFLVPDEGEAVDGELPVTFEDIATTLELGEPTEGELVDPLPDSVEEFNPDVIFYTLFPGEIEGGDEVIALEEGEVVEGEEGSVEVIEEVPVDQDGDGVPDDAVVEYPVVKDGGEDTVYTIEMVKRGLDGDPPTDLGTEYNPDWIFYTMAGAPNAGGEVTTGAVDHEPVAGTPADAAEISAPDHASASPDVQESATPVVERVAASAHPFDVQAADGRVAIPHVDAASPVTHFETTLPATPSDLPVNHDLQAIEFTPVPLAFADHQSAEVPGSIGGVNADTTVDTWVPMHTEMTNDGPLLAPLDAIPTERGTDHEISVLDAGAVVPGHNATLQGSAIAMAATGAVLLTRDARVREVEERA